MEKAIGYRASLLAIALAASLRKFVFPRNLGVVSGEAGMMRLFARPVGSPMLRSSLGTAFPAASSSPFPGFTIPLRDLFAELDKTGAP